MQRKHMKKNTKKMKKNRHINASLKFSLPKIKHVKHQAINT